MKVTRDITQPKRSPNRRKLTGLFVDKVAPSERRTRIWDTDAPGLVLQVEPSGSRTWYAYYRRNGRPRWYRLGAVGGLGLSATRDVVRRLKARLVLDPAYDPQAEKVANRTQGTVADLAERYVTDHLDYLKSGEQAKYLLRRFVLPKIGNLSAAGVQRSDIRSLLNGVASVSTRGQVHANVSGMFNWAIRNTTISLSLEIRLKVSSAAKRQLASEFYPPANYQSSGLRLTKTV